MVLKRLVSQNAGPEMHRPCSVRNRSSSYNYIDICSVIIAPTIAEFTGPDFRLRKMNFLTPTFLNPGETQSAHTLSQIIVTPYVQIVTLRAGTGAGGGGYPKKCLGRGGGYAPQFPSVSVCLNFPKQGL